MKKSIIYFAIAMLSITNTFAAGSLSNPQGSTSHETEADSLKKMKPASTNAETELLNPETVFLRIEGMSNARLIVEDLAITDFSIKSAYNNLAYPVITNLAVKENDLIIDAEESPLMTLDFAIIDTISQGRGALKSAKVGPSL